MCVQVAMVGTMPLLSLCMEKRRFYYVLADTISIFEFETGPDSYHISNASALTIQVLTFPNFIFIDRRCPPPPQVPNSASVRIFRKDLDSTPSVFSAIYNDLAQYECRPGFALRSIHQKTLCHGHGSWTNAPECIRKYSLAKSILTNKKKSKKM